MTRTLTSIAVVATALMAVSRTSRADEVRVATAISRWDKPVTEEQCLAKAKAALTASGLTNHLAPMGTHSYVGGKADVSIDIDCLQYVGANAVHVSVATANKKSDEIANLLLAITKELTK